MPHNCSLLAVEKAVPSREPRNPALLAPAHAGESAGSVRPVPMWPGVVSLRWGLGYPQPEFHSPSDSSDPIGPREGISRPPDDSFSIQGSGFLAAT